jgi:hypothetical protein
MHGAAIVPELDSAGAPPAAQAEPWFSERHATQWLRARELAMTAPFAVMDGDPLKGLWYNWMHAAEGWPGIDVIEPLYRSQIARGEIGFPALYIHLDATEVQLRQRRADDPTRQRRGFEKHVRTRDDQRRYFAALGVADPGRVVFVDTSSRASLPDRVMDAVRNARRDATDPMALLGAMARWIRMNPPRVGSGDGSLIDG